MPVEKCLIKIADMLSDNKLFNIEVFENSEITFIEEKGPSITDSIIIARMDKEDAIKIRDFLNYCYPKE